jgi:methyltransferase (TIGR00027 family)
MQEGKFSRTAFSVALRRAAHQIFDGGQVLQDPLAVRIVGEQAAAKLRSDPKGATSTISLVMRAFMAARSRYAEDQLAHAFGQGVRQYVVLGAGLDTFAYRNPHSGLRVFEIDHPATQALKRERLHAESIAIPESVKYVPVDFEKQSLAEQLEQSPFDSAAPAFFSWLGVTPYLTREACMGTFAYLAKRPTGSGVTFDFALDRALLNMRQKLALYALSKRVAMAGEPFRLFFFPDKLAEELRQLGFHRIEVLSGAQINARYFHGRTDGLRVGNIGQLMTAWV